MRGKRFFLIGIALLMSATALAAPNKARLVIDASQPATVDLSDLGLPQGSRVEYVLLDYQGKEVMRGAAPLWADGTTSITMAVAPGYYEIHYPEQGKTFGVVVLPGAPDTQDPFFCTDAALSWLTESEERPYLIDILARMGIDTGRERLRWAAVESDPGTFDWYGGADYDKTRGLYAQRGVKVLEVCHDAPAWMGHVGKYPADLTATAQSWRAMGTQWGTVWGSVEMWNEPDIDMFSGGMPADQYVPLQKVAASIFGQEPGFALVGGIFTHLLSDEYWELCVKNGLLDTVDAISFHTYDHAPTVEELVAQYRVWLEEAGKPSMPLWITESGRPWQEPNGRPSRIHDAESALDITMKGIEFRACGGAKYFPFVFPYYEERGNIFSMMHEDGSPHRSIGAYATAIHVLSNTRYVGDLSRVTPAIARARLFRAGRDEIVAVLYTGKVEEGALVDLPLPALRVAGIDGRSLAFPGNTVPVPDGLTYAWFDQAAIVPYIETETAAMALYATGHQPPPQRPAAPSVVLQPSLDLEVVDASPLYYTIPEAAGAGFELGVLVNNLGTEPETVTLTLGGYTGDSAFTLAGTDAEAVVQVAPGVRARQAFMLKSNLDHVTAEPGIVTVTGRLADGSALAPAAVALRAEPTLERLLAQYPTARPFALRADLAPGQSSGTMALTMTDADEWRLEVRFDKPDGGDHWAYPPMDVAGRIDFTRTKGFVLSARLEKPGEARILLFEEGGRYGFFIPQALVPADGEWHATSYLLEEVVNMPTHAKPCGKPDWSRVDKMAVGVSTTEMDNVLMVREFHVIDAE